MLQSLHEKLVYTARVKRLLVTEFTRKESGID